MTVANVHTAEDGKFDRIGEAISHPYRRKILLKLYDSESVDNVVVDEKRREQNRVELHHVHLPKLDALGYIDWDQEAGTVAPGERWGEIRPMIEMIRQNGISDQAV